MKRIIQLVLVVVIVVLAVLLITNLRNPIVFQDAYAQRKAKVVERLKEIRALEQAYKSTYGHYVGSFDSLENFYKNGKMQTIRSVGSLDDSATMARTDAYQKLYKEQQNLIKARRPVRGETLKALVDLSDEEILQRGLAARKPVFDDVKSVVRVKYDENRDMLLSEIPNFNIDELKYVPGLEVEEGQARPQFQLSAKMKETSSKVLVPLFEAKVSNDVFLKGLDQQQIVNLNDQMSKSLVNSYPGLKVGDIENPNNDAGNWE
jgi:hypothetical protein